MDKRDIVVVGGSAGATAPLRDLVRALPADFAASLFIVTHVPTHGARLLGDVLRYDTDLPVVYPEHGAPISPGRIYIAPADRHLLLEADKVMLGCGPRENLVRPAVDPLFRSAALAFGPRVVGVILSGMLNDGASGLWAIRARGGLAVVQHPGEAHAPEMPQAAMRAVEPDHIAPSAAIGPLIAELTRQDAPDGPVDHADELRLEVDIAAGARSTVDRLAAIADAAPFTCPDCNGVLSQVRGQRPLRFRCQTGHAITAEALDDLHHRQVEEAVRVAMRVLEERAALVVRMAEEARLAGRPAAAGVYEVRAEEYGEQAEILRGAALRLMDREAETVALEEISSET